MNVLATVISSSRHSKMTSTLVEEHFQALYVFTLDHNTQMIIIMFVTMTMVIVLLVGTKPFCSNLRIEKIMQVSFCLRLTAVIKWLLIVV